MLLGNKTRQFESDRSGLIWGFAGLCRVSPRSRNPPEQIWMRLRDAESLGKALLRD